MDPHLEHHLCQALGTSSILDRQTIQTLWSGCGHIARVWYKAAEGRGPEQTAVIKHVKMPERIIHPRGWDTDRSAERKVRSYEVETQWYARWSQRCSASCRVPKYLGHATRADERLLILEDIDASGFGLRAEAGAMQERTRAALRHKAAGLEADIEACIRWLAAFHAAFLGERPVGLWDKGTYWHLDTRPDEFDALEDGRLKRAAKTIDAALDASPFQTIVHGDAKLANFCFSEDNHVAAVDFQYVGGGCGMKDLAYFVGSCLNSDACFERQSHVLTIYFSTLASALSDRGADIDTAALEADWRRLWPYAWADFQRFLMGWSPGHWKIGAYSEAMTQRVLDELGL